MVATPARRRDARYLGCAGIKLGLRMTASGMEARTTIVKRRWRDRMLQEDFRSALHVLQANPGGAASLARQGRRAAGPVRRWRPSWRERELSLGDSIGAATISSMFRTAASTNPIPQVAQSRGREGSRATLPRRVQRLILRSSRSRA